jgi:prolyl oligopeptidase
MTPDEIHELGKRELGKVRSDMRRLIREMRYSGSLESFMDALRVNPRFYYDSPDSLLAGFRAILSDMDAKLPQLFGRLPKQWYDLREIEAYRAPSAPAAYYYGAPDDGSRPAYFYVNTYRPETRPRYTMEALAYHEAVPGHHLQLTLQQEMENLPEFRRHGGFTAFVEGWALYSERLPKEVGFYRDYYSEFGRLTFEAWRAARLLVDTGIHHFKWTREEAIEFLTQNTSLSETDIISEVERYISWPGQALAYKIGQIKILEIRAHAEDRLGEDFDIRRFHDALLEEGALSLDLLEAKMARWTSAQVSANWRAKREARQK